MHHLSGYNLPMAQLRAFRQWGSRRRFRELAAAGAARRRDWAGRLAALTLRALAKAIPELVGGSADLTESTCTRLDGDPVAAGALVATKTGGAAERGGGPVGPVAGRRPTAG